MSPFEILLLVCGAVLALSSLVVVYRMIVGPTILDRAVSTDTFVVLLVLGIALYTAQARAPWAGPAMLTLTGLTFIGTVTFSRFVAREDTLQGRHLQSEGPDTVTAEHEVIHDVSGDGDPGPSSSRAGAAGPGAASGASSANTVPTDLDVEPSGFGGDGADRGFEAFGSEDDEDDEQDDRARRADDPMGADGSAEDAHDAQDEDFGAGDGSFGAADEGGRG